MAFLLRQAQFLCRVRTAHAFEYHLRLEDARMDKAVGRCLGHRPGSAAEAVAGGTMSRSFSDGHHDSDNGSPIKPLTATRHSRTSRAHVLRLTAGFLIDHTTLNSIKEIAVFFVSYFVEAFEF